MSNWGDRGGSPRQEQLQGQSFHVTESSSGMLEVVPSVYWRRVCVCSTVPRPSGPPPLPASTCHSALLCLWPQVWVFFFTAYSVSESKRTDKNFWGTFVQDPGRKALPSWRAEEGLSYRSGWDLKPALSSSLSHQASAGQLPKVRAGCFGFPVWSAKYSTGFHWILFMALASKKEILQHLSFSICTACSIQALTPKIENKMVQCKIFPFKKDVPSQLKVFRLYYCCPYNIELEPQSFTYILLDGGSKTIWSLFEWHTIFNRPE